MRFFTSFFVSNNFFLVNCNSFPSENNTKIRQVHYELGKLLLNFGELDTIILLHKKIIFN